MVLNLVDRHGSTPRASALLFRPAVDRHDAARAATLARARRARERGALVRGGVNERLELCALGALEHLGAVRPPGRDRPSHPQGG
jgi:hypothetical protein